jgi:hypothetical protein
MEYLALQASQFYWLIALGHFDQVLYGNMQNVRNTL